MRYFIFIFLLINTAQATDNLLNVSYDATRELYRALNKQFTLSYYQNTGHKIIIKQSHSGSGKQVNALLHGLRGNVVSLANSHDIDILAQNNLLAKNWRQRFKNNSVPYFSTIVFLVRRNNPKNIRDWPDLTKRNIDLITPNPKTSGGAVWNYLAALSFSKIQNMNDMQIKNFMKQIFGNVKILDTTARNASMTFTKRKIGDVLITWESEALLINNVYFKNQFEIIYPSVSIIINLPVTYLDKNIKTQKDLILAQQYIKFLFSCNGQKIIKQNFYNTSIEDLYNKVRKTQFLQVSELGKFTDIKQLHLATGGIFDQIYS